MKEDTKRRIEAERKVALDAYIKKTVDNCPPLSPSPRDRPALLLRPTITAITPEPTQDADVVDASGADALTEMMGEI